MRSLQDGKRQRWALPLALPPTYGVAKASPFSIFGHDRSQQKAAFDILVSNATLLQRGQAVHSVRGRENQDMLWRGWEPERLSLSPGSVRDSPVVIPVATRNQEPPPWAPVRKQMAPSRPHGLGGPCSLAGGGVPLGEVCHWDGGLRACSLTLPLSHFLDCGCELSAASRFCPLLPSLPAVADPRPSGAVSQSSFLCELLLLVALRHNTITILF